MDVQVKDVRFGQQRPRARVLGGAAAAPTLSWRVDGAGEGWRQERCEIQVMRRGATTVYPLASDASVGVPWPGEPLASGEAATVAVRVAGAEGEWSAWSAPATYECGKLARADWQARPITPEPMVAREDPAPVLYRRFTVGAGAADARLSITAGGVFAAYLDGERIGADELAPGWTEYGKRMLVRTYDVTAALAPGEHELAVILGNGWYRGKLTWACRTNVYGDRLWLLAELGWRDAGGSHRVDTDERWRWRPSAILANDLYDGQRTDLRLPLLGDAAAEGAAVGGYELSAAVALVPAEAPAARIVDTLPARELITTPSGKRIVDFGQNLSGWVRMRVRGAHEGDVLTLRHAEVLEHGELGTRPLRNAKATDEFILAEAAEQTAEPLFTQHGFRYVEVEGAADIAPEDFTACVVAADMAPTATFTCSDELVNRLFENARWSEIDNFLAVPTDCPQRDERLGWTGDIAVFANTATQLLDASAFLSSWLEDVKLDQAADGGIPVVVPNVLDPAKLTCGWGDAAVLVPWAVYEASGDARVLERFLPLMDAFVDGVDARCGDRHLWEGGFQFGDWLDPDAPVDDPGKSKADPDVVATAYFAHSARLTAQAHEAVGDAAGAARYGALADAIAAAFRDAYVTADGRVISDCVSVYAMPLAWDLLATDRQRAGAGRRLADLVRLSGFHISTGFLGTPLVCEALERAGYADVAMRLLLQRTCPSWLYPVTMGATTVWERWDSMLPDGSINPGEMTSFNHYALGAVASWLLTGVAGVKPLAPGWQRVRIAPVVGAGLDHAAMTQETPYGTIACSWKRDAAAGTLHVELTLPAGVTAEVELPAGTATAQVAGAGTWSWDVAASAPARKPLAAMTIRDFIDDPACLDALAAALAACASPVYAHGDAAAIFCKGASAHLDAPARMVPQVAANLGYMPGADAIIAAAQGCLDELEA